METAIQTTAQLPQLAHARNPGMPLDLDWVASVQANTSAIERRAATLGGRRSVKKEFQAAWLLKAISLIDLTTLSGDDTWGRVERLCAKARQPVAEPLLEQLGMQGLTTGAVCVYHDMVETAVRALEGTSIPVAAVSTGFPAGLSPYKLRIAEIGESLIVRMAGPASCKPSTSGPRRAIRVCSFHCDGRSPSNTKAPRPLWRTSG